ncbi:alcohol dehydrogenase catalytic domain-containing protein [Rhodococcus sp. NPDC003318]|uniref:alcohol dehydrogenase catalytic domain-containing protein n=1 Tax=Rhodococcus sp. NPDC003318 TaxID=3364503 RepID=UPI0036A02702
MADLPVIGGREGSGIVEKVGPGVRSVAVGDHVVGTFMPSCGTCRWHFAESIDAATTLVHDITHRVMADVVILTVGVAHGDMIQQMVAPARKGGKVVLTAIAPLESTAAQVPLAEVTVFQKQLRGSLYGECVPRVDIPRLLALYKSGQLDLDALVSREYTLDEGQPGLRRHEGRDDHARRDRPRALTATPGRR